VGEPAALSSDPRAQRVASAIGMHAACGGGAAFEQPAFLRCLSAVLIAAEGG